MPTKNSKKIFVLDTSVLLFDYEAIKNFQNNDVAIPITVLEELDTFKKGNNVINLHAREFIRFLDTISDTNMLQNWIPIGDDHLGKLKVISNGGNSVDANKIFGTTRNDHHILNAALKLKAEHTDTKVILVSKDINLRLKARALNLDAEDYETVQVKNIDHLYSGKTELEIGNPTLIAQFYEKGSISLDTLVDEEPPSNHYFILKSHGSSALGMYNASSKVIEKVDSMNAYGIHPRNAEQTFALHAMLNPNILLVSITGAAGTGKTLLALASALEQRSQFKQIYLVAW